MGWDEYFWTLVGCALVLIEVRHVDIVNIARIANAVTITLYSRVTM